MCVCVCVLVVMCVCVCVCVCFHVLSSYPRCEPHIVPPLRPAHEGEELATCVLAVHLTQSQCCWRLGRADDKRINEVQYTKFH